jgi:H+/gluconate symporter-like permease
MATISAGVPPPTSMHCWRSAEPMTLIGLAGVLGGLALLIAFAFRGWSVLLLAPVAALIASLFSREPLLAHWTLTFMGGAADFLARFFPLFLLGAVFGKLMEDSGSVTSIAAYVTQRLGPHRAMLAVVLAGALVTYGGVSLFVAFFVLAPMAQELFRAANIPRRLMPAAIVLGTSTFTMSALPGTPSIQNAIPMPFFGTTPFAAPGVGIMASVIMLGFGLWWLGRQERAAKQVSEGFGGGAPLSAAHFASDEKLRERAVAAREFDPAEIVHGKEADMPPPIALAALPLVVVVAVNFAMSLFVLPALDTRYLAEPRFGGVSLADLGGIWAVITALTCAIVTVIAVSHRRLPDLRATVDAGANAAVLPVMNVASLVGFGAVVAAMPAFAKVRDAVLGIGGGPLVSLAVATNLLAALTGSASGGLTIALDALGATYLERAASIGLDPGLLHRVAVIGSGTLDSLPHNGAVVTLLAVCGSTHRESYRDIVMVGIVGAVIALVAVIAVGSMVGSF